MKEFKPLQATDIVIFGANGHLAFNKIMPALFYRYIDGQLPKDSRIIAIGRKDIESADYIKALNETLYKIIPSEDIDEEKLEKFNQRIKYIAIPDIAKKSGYNNLKIFLDDNMCKVRMFYLATPSSIFGKICHSLQEAGLITNGSRVVLEKPLGHDLESSRAINKSVLECFSEQQIYRIDHYLGKETVQNLMIIRFANNLFERVWNGDAIDNIEITVSEDSTIGNRAGYYDKAGAMRDMVQNHLLQLLCLVAMEPPPHIDADSVRDEKMKVLKSLKSIGKEEISANLIRAQYESYKQDCGNSDSDTETFVAIKVGIDNWRWANTDFYLRTGKNMKEKYSEISLNFKHVPHSLFPNSADGDEPINKLIIRLQPDESVKLQMITKIPGPGGYRLKPVDLNLSLAEEFTQRQPCAYERLLMDVIRANQTLFMRIDEVEAAWKWTDEIINSWQEEGLKCQIYKDSTCIKSFGLGS